MIIGIDARIVEHRNFGITRYAENLIRSLSKADRKNIYHIYASKKGIRHVEALNLSGNFVVKKTVIPLFFPLEHRLFSIMLEKDPPAIFHSTSFLVPSRRICPSIVTMHDIIAFKFVTNYFSPIERLYHELAVKRASHILTVSKASKYDIVSLFGVSEDKITHVYNGVNKVKRTAPPRLPFKYILYVGSVQEYKNVAMLLRAYDIVREKTGVRLVLVLHDTLGINARQHVMALLKMHNISRRGIHIIKNISDEGLGGLYKHAEAFVFLSQYEGFGLPVIEAMAYGAPVVASRLSCMPEITGGAAISTDITSPEKPAKDILGLLEDSDLKKELSERGIKRAAFFTWEKCAAGTLAVYEKLHGQMLNK